MKITELQFDGALAPAQRSRFSFRRAAQTIRTIENNEELVYLADQANVPFLLAPFWEDNGDLEGGAYQVYIANHPHFGLAVRRSVYVRLREVAGCLPHGWKLVLKAGLRPLAVQNALLEKLVNKIMRDHPQWSFDQALARARLFVADPSLKIPPHCTGAAIDIEVCDAEGETVDMGCPPNTDSELAYTHSDLLSPHQRANRGILLEAMLAAGFANLAYEWWHFSYGDAYWAAFYNRPTAIYGIVKELGRSH
ncbi:MAG TPA: M15 family metallopeptidase [Candidatus Saccharimonadales bacterium]|nr:M15 family metallopeptidase [Candidatus Saccharimonadales bacterium]